MIIIIITIIIITIITILALISYAVALLFYIHSAFSSF